MLMLGSDPGHPQAELVLKCFESAPARPAPTSVSEAPRGEVAAAPGLFAWLVPSPGCSVFFLWGWQQAVAMFQSCTCALALSSLRLGRGLVSWSFSFSLRAACPGTLSTRASQPPCSNSPFTCGSASVSWEPGPEPCPSSPCRPGSSRHSVKPEQSQLGFHCPPQRAWPDSLQRKMPLVLLQFAELT